MDFKQFVIERKSKLIIFAVLFAYIFINVILYNSCHVHCIGGCIRASWCPDWGKWFYEMNETIFTVLISPLLLLSFLLMIFIDYSTASQTIEILAIIVLTYLYACLINAIFRRNRHH